MKVYFTFCFLLSLIGTSFTSFAQEKDANSNSTSKFTFGWSYSPEASYRFLVLDTEANSSGFYYPAEDYVNQRNEYERAKYGYSANFFFGYQISKMLTLETGLGYTDFGDGLKPTEITFGQGPDYQYATMTGKTHIGFVTLPISVRLKLGGERYQWFISAGAALGYRLRYSPNFEIELPNGTLDPGYYIFALDRDEISSFILEAHISGGIDIQMSKKTSIRIAPSLRITATDTYLDRPVKGYFYNVGINLGMVHKL